MREVLTPESESAPAAVAVSAGGENVALVTETGAPLDGGTHSRSRRGRPRGLG